MILVIQALLLRRDDQAATGNRALGFLQLGYIDWRHIQTALRQFFQRSGKRGRIDKARAYAKRVSRMRFLLVHSDQITIPEGRPIDPLRIDQERVGRNLRYSRLQVEALCRFHRHNGKPKTRGDAAQLFDSLPVVCVLALAYLGVTLYQPKRANGLSWLIITVGMIGASYISNLHSGSFINVNFPAFAQLSILFGLAIAGMFEFSTALRHPLWRLLTSALLTCCLVQFYWLRYDPRPLIPTEVDRRAGHQLTTIIRKIKGEVLIPRHGYLAQKAGKNSYAHEMAMSDVLRGDRRGAKNPLIEEISAAIVERRFSAIIVDYHWLRPLIKKEYAMNTRLIDDPHAFWPVTGNRTRPKYLYLPKD